MTHREELYEKYQDALFALLMDEGANAEGKKALEENERLKKDPTAGVPPEVSERCLKRIDREFRKQDTKKMRKVTFKVAQYVAIIMLTGLLFFTGAFALSDAFRSATLNLIIKNWGDSIDFYFTHEDENEETQVQIGWLPDGVSLLETTTDTMGIVYIYGDKKDKNLVIAYYLVAGSSFSFDTENADYISDILINDHQAILIKKGDAVQIIQNLPEKNALLHITGENISESDMIRCAESIIY